MVTVRKTVFVRCVAVALSLILIGTIASLIYFGVSHQSKNDLQSSTGKEDSTTYQKLQDVPHYNPNHPDNNLDLSSESETSPSSKSNNRRVEKPQVKSFPLNDADVESLLLSDKAELRLEKEMIHLLSSIVSPVSQPNVKANDKTKSNIEFQSKMINIFTSIISRETNMTEKESLVEVLSSLVSEHGIDHDIKKKMTHVLLNILYRHEVDPEVKLQMANLMSDIISQDSDEALKREILNTLWKISSQDIENGSKSQMVTILSAIAREDNSAEMKLKLAKTLSSMVHLYGEHDTRLEIVRLLSRMVPSSESLKSTTEDAAEQKFLKKPASVDAKVEMSNIMLGLTQDDKEKKVAKQLIDLLSSIASPVSQISIKANVKTNKNRNKLKSEMINLFTSIVSQEINPTERGSLVEVLSSLVSELGIEPDIKNQITHVLMNIVYRHETDPEVKLQMANLMSDVISEDSDEALKWKILHTLSKICSQGMDTKSKSRMITILSVINKEKNSADLKLELATKLSSIVQRYGDDDTRLDMANLLSMMVSSAENLQSTIGDAAEPKLPKKTASVDEKVEMSNIMLDLAQGEKANKFSEQLIDLLSSIASPISQTSIKAIVKTNKNLEFQSEMIKLFTSIVSRETSPRERGSLIEVLSSLASEHGIDPDIKTKMTHVLLNIAYRHETDPKVQLQMAKLMSDVISQDSDEALKWKILNTLSKISSQDMETESKSKMVTLLSAIARDENSADMKLELVTALSSMVHLYGEQETRLDMTRLLSRLLPSSKSLEATTENAMETAFPKKSTSSDEKVAMVNIMLDEEETKVAKRFMEKMSSIKSSPDTQMKQALKRILSNDEYYSHFYIPRRD